MGKIKKIKTAFAEQGKEWKKQLRSEKANQIPDKLAGSILPGPAC